jgi:hypothetical protein
VVYDLAGLTDELEAELPSRFGGLGSRLSYPGDERLEYAFEAERGPLELSAAGDTVRVITELSYGGQVWYATPLGELTTSCGIEAGGLSATAPRATIQMSFPLVVDSAWAVRSVPTVDRVEPASASDRCVAVVLQFQVDATDAIMLGLRDWLEEEAARVGSRIEAVSPRPYAEEWWTAVQSPIEVASGAWLVLQPETLSYRIGGPSSSSASIAGEIGATVRPRVVVGPRPPTSSRALPALGTASSTVADSSGWVDVEAVVAYEDASDLAGLEGAEWEALGRTVRVVSAELSGNDDGRVALSLEIEGDVPARVRLVGTPTIDADAAELSVPDLDVALESGGTLPRVLVWTARLFPGVLRSRARLPLEPLVPAQLDEPFELRLSDEATLDASFTDLEVTAVVATDEGVVVRARVRPVATLRVDS